MTRQSRWSSASLSVKDVTKERPQAREASPHLLPPVGAPLKRRSRTMSGMFWPAASTIPYQDISSSTPTATSSPSVSGNTENRTSTLEIPKPVLSSVYPVNCANINRTSRESSVPNFSRRSLYGNQDDQILPADNAIGSQTFKGFLSTTLSDPSSPGDIAPSRQLPNGIFGSNLHAHDPPVESPIHRRATDESPTTPSVEQDWPAKGQIGQQASQRTRPTNIRDRDPRAQERNSYDAESIPSVRQSQAPVPLSQRDARFIEKMLSHIADTDDQPITDVRKPDTERASNLTDTGVHRRKSDRNVTPSTKRPVANLLRLGLSKLNCMWKRSIRRSKQPAGPNISGIQVSGADANGITNAGSVPAHPSRATAAGARLQAIAKAHFLRARRPLTCQTADPGSEGSPHPAGLSLMQSLHRGLCREKPDKMSLAHAGQRDVVISEVMAVERWGLPMRQYPIENGVVWLEGELEHTEKFAWTNIKCERSQSRENRARTTQSAGGIPMVNRNERRTGESAGDEKKKSERQQKGEGELWRQSSLTSDLYMGSSAGKIGGTSVAAKNGAGKGTSDVRQRKRQIADEIIILPLKAVPRMRDSNKAAKETQHSFDDSGYGDSSSNSTPTSRTTLSAPSTPTSGTATDCKLISSNRVTTSGKGSHHYSPTPRYSLGSVKRNSLQPPLYQSQYRQVEAAAEVIRQSGQSNTGNFRTTWPNQKSVMTNSLRALARMEDELMVAEKETDWPENCDGDWEDSLLAERIRFEPFKEQHLSRRETRQSQSQSQSRARTFRPVRQRESAQDRDRWMSRIPVPVPSARMADVGADELTPYTHEHRLSQLKAMKKEVFARARLYEDCVLSLERRPLSLSTERQRKSPIWPLSLAGGSPESPLENRTTRVASCATIRESPDQRAAPLARDSALSSPGLDYGFSAQGKQPLIRNRSSERGNFHLPFCRDTAVVLPASSSETRQPVLPWRESGGQHDNAMPVSVCGCGGWSLRHGLNEPVDVRNLSISEGFDAEVAAGLEEPDNEDRTLTPQPLNPGGRRKWSLEDTVEEDVRRGYSPTQYGDHSF